MLARKLTTLRRWSAETLAHLAALPVATIREIESGAGLVELGELEALARAFATTVIALLMPPRRTVEQRVMLALLEG